MVADPENPLVLSVLHASSTAYSFFPDKAIDDVSVLRLNKISVAEIMLIEDQVSWFLPGCHSFFLTKQDGNFYVWLNNQMVEGIDKCKLKVIFKVKRLTG